MVRGLVHHGAESLKRMSGTLILLMPGLPTEWKRFSALSWSYLLEMWSARKLDLVSIFLIIGANFFRQTTYKNSLRRELRSGSMVSGT